MKRISYENFKELLLKYPNFNSKTLKSLEKEFGVNIVNDHFEKLIEEDVFEEYIKYYDIYLQNKDVNDDDMIVNLGGVFGEITVEKSKCDILSFDEERECVKNLNDGNKNLSIIINNYNVGDNDENERLYPHLNLGLIFASVKDNETLELLNNVRRLKFSLGDDNIFSKESADLKKFIKLCSNGIVDKKTLKNNFPSLNFNRCLSKERIDYELNLLKDYVVAKNKLYYSNLRLVISLAKRICKNSIVSEEDKMQIGTLGLIRAINRFDYERNTKVSTYATHWIKQKISRYVADTETTIRRPVHIYDNLYRYKTFVRNYIVANGVIPSDEEIMEALEFTRGTLDVVKKTSVGELSLDNTYFSAKDGDETNMLELVDNGEELIEDKVVRETYMEYLIKIINDCLNENERYIFYNRIGLNPEDEKQTLETIGKKYGLTRERIRQREQKILYKVRKNINRELKK